jgi:hypothetical protein
MKIREEQRALLSRQRLVAFWSNQSSKVNGTKHETVVSTCLERFFRKVSRCD